MIPTITLWQPYATLIAFGIKTRETRTRKPPERLIGTRIGIHAAKRPPDWADITHPIREALWREGWSGRRADLPLGMVVATALLARVDRADGTQLDPFGDYSEGRFYWTLADVERLDPPVAARGHQWFWKWEPNG